MKRDYKYLTFITLITALTTSCELVDDIGSGGDTILRLEGQWKCDETSQYFKKSTMSIYYVYIAPHSTDTTRVIITNFYQLGDAVEASAKLNGQKLTLDPQNLSGGYKIVSGTGSISSGYKTINWSYKIDFGGGDIDNVTAVYTKAY